jgi:hypothetical protein
LWNVIQASDLDRSFGTSQIEENVMRLHVRPRRGWKDNIRMKLKEIG